MRPLHLGMDYESHSIFLFCVDCDPYWSLLKFWFSVINLTESNLVWELFCRLEKWACDTSFSDEAYFWLRGFIRIYSIHQKIPYFFESESNDFKIEVFHLLVMISTRRRYYTLHDWKCTTGIVISKMKGKNVKITAIYSDMKHQWNSSILTFLRCNLGITLSHVRTHTLS